MNEASIGCRLECEGAKGTIKWIGELPSVNNLWYGVEWDKEERGKHDGSHQGVQYFKTRGEKSASFVRPSKASLGMALEEAVKGRYQDDAHIEEALTAQLRRNIKARFVEVVGMEKIGKRQSDLSHLKTAVLDGWPVGGCDPSMGLGSLVPRLRDLDVSNTLLSSWDQVATITRQIPTLKFLNVSGNLLRKPTEPSDLVASTGHVTHVVMNRMLTYSWQDLMTCAQLFPDVWKMQLAFNSLSALGPVPAGVFRLLRDLDVGVNPIADWDQVCHLGTLPNLQVLNLNRCRLTLTSFGATPPGVKTPLFPALSSLMLADNPLSYWDSVGELDKLSALSELVLSHEELIGRGNFFLEFTFARIRTLKMLNRTCVTPREKKDFELFYLRSFSKEYYAAGGAGVLEAGGADPPLLTPDFVKRHPTYVALATVHGPPLDERNHSSQKSERLKDLKVELLLVPE